jgi:hypothetical protein
MIIERANGETIIKIPNNVKLEYLQQFLDYLSVKSILSKSQATDQEIENLSEEVKREWWKKNKSRFIDEGSS